MSQALYRKYRSRSFDEIVGQKSVVMALKNALKNNAISHAYLFTGPRGVGKTSIARIFAYAINNVPYDTDELPVDIIEIDAASNRGIDEVRDLRDKVRIAPVIGPYKVYIIDEVHMLTSHAFNALLKTLEEPPAHVVFILATTESHKLPETITSRTQRYNFSLATTQEVVEHLADICKKESLDVSDEALTIIAKSSGGSLRDALSLLDHARHIGNVIGADDIRQHIGMPSDEIVNDIITAIADNDAAGVLQKLAISDSGVISSVALARHIIDAITVTIQNDTNVLSLSKTTALLHALISVETSTHQDIALRIALLSAINAEQSIHQVQKPVIAKQKHTEDVAKKRIDPLRSENKSETSASQTIESKPIEPPKPVAQTTTAQDTISTDGAKQLTHDAWKLVLEDIRATHNTLYSVLRMAEANFEEIASNKLTLNFKFPFHQKRISEMKNKDIISNKIANLGYGNFEIVCGITEKKVLEPTEIPPNPTPPAIEDKDAVLSQIRGVFGSAEVLE